MLGISILDRHLAVALLGAAALTAVVLLGLSGFVSLVEELDWAHRHDMGLAEAAALTAYKLPELLFEMFPLIVLLGAILGLGSLASAGELVVMQTAGMPVWRLALSVAMVGLVLGLASLVIGDRVVPAARAEASAIKHGEKSDIDGGRELWLREGRSFVHIAAVKNSRFLNGIRVYEVADDNNQILAVQSADQAVYQDGRWVAEGWRRETPNSLALSRESHPSKVLDLDFGPDVVELFLLRADSLSLPGLQRYVRYLELNKLDSHAPRLEMWKKLAAPVAVVAMVLIAVPFVLGPLRDTGAGQRLFFGVLMGIGFYVFNETVVSMGAVYRWPPALAAFSPAVVLSLLAGWRLARHRAK